MIRKLLSLIGFIAVCVVAYWIWSALSPSQNIPNDVKAFGEYTAKTTTCMVEKSWDSLQESTRETLSANNGDLTKISASEMLKVIQFSSECK